jgi:hypothetical protein
LSPAEPTKNLDNIQRKSLANSNLKNFGEN